MKIFVFVLNFKGVDNCSQITEIRISCLALSLKSLSSVYILGYRGNNNSNMQLLEFNNVTNANSKHQITEPKERQNGIFNKEDQLNGPSMAAKDFSKDDDIVVINCIEEVSNTNNT